MTDYVLPAQELAAMLDGAPWRRLAVIGDSIASGVREPHPGYRDLSWTDRIAEALGDVEVLNLGERDLTAQQVRERQLAGAVAFRPDLAVVAAGGNDALSRAFDPASVDRELDAMVATFRRFGADVLMIELMDIVRSGLVAPEYVERVDERLAALASVTRVVAQRRGAVLVRMRLHDAAADPGVYASDRLHLNARGHAIVATQAVRALSKAIPQVRSAAA